MQRPNIIFIMADDMGFGDVGCYNPETKIPTPNMDRLASEGIRFTDAHSPSAVCTPSRYGVLTGRYCWRSRLKYSVLFGYEPPLIERDRLTVQGMLKDVGYHTACIGKWHLGLRFSARAGMDFDFDAPLPWPVNGPTREDEEKIDFSKPLGGGPTDLGFDYFFGTAGCSTANPPYGFIENDRFVDPPSVYRAENWLMARPGMTSPGWDDRDADPAFTRKAVQYIEKRAASDGPFFLYLCPTSPHQPNVEEVVPEFARQKSEAGARGDMVWLVDWMVGEIMNALDRTGLADNTLIMVTSDNGAERGDIKPELSFDWSTMTFTDPAASTVEAIYNMHGHKSCGDWRGYKGFIWEGGHREPLIARWPARVKPNTVSDQLVGLTDFLATCAAINGIELGEEAPEDSVNILPALLGEQTNGPLRDSLIHHSASGVFSIRKGSWKCIFDTEAGGRQRAVLGSPGQLYNMADDPLERVNLWNDRQDIVAELRELIEYERSRTGAE